MNGQCDSGKRQNRSGEIGVGQTVLPGWESAMPTRYPSGFLTPALLKESTRFPKHVNMPPPTMRKGVWL